ncbi:MAG: EAL domain-containing protein [Alphaproteobacteria bacterium]|uniref:EAL domain-containing protein n=1 Tax=Candidatus Nitrobium versatile TaxID=2884831 RepID=A0A953JCF3_9BACT|nr:EAL domain-containing protein [Candidatus Nitrobium versatile]
MKKPPSDLALLRKKAEQKLRKQTKRVEELSKQDIQRLVHELGTHQIELEMQNEELRHARTEMEISHRKYSDLFDFAPVGYFLIDHLGLIKEVNLTGADMLGIQKRLLQDRPFFLFVHKDDRSTFHSHLKETLERQSRQTCEVRIGKKDGSLLHFQLQSIAVEDRKGAEALCRTTVTDITERKHWEEQLRESEEKYRELVQSARSIILKTDMQGTIIFFNEFAQEFFGYTVAEAAGRKVVGTIVPPLSPSAQVFREMLVSITLDPNHYQEIEGEGTRKNGERVWIAWTNRPIRDRSGNLTGVLTAGQDITERKRAEETMQHQAHHDALTGLLNKTHFMEYLSNALRQARRYGYMLAVMFLDLDRFKAINDSLGHAMGDTLLQSVSERLRASVRDSDVIARIGGDEYTILLPHISHAEDAAKTAEKILEHFTRSFLLDGNELYCGISIGISLFPEDGEQPETLLRNADIALYHVKEHGRGTFEFYNPAMNIRTLERMILESNLRRTLERGELVVYYQPQVSIDSRTPLCAEALVRWQHPERGLLNPFQFLPVAEETGFIVPMDEWVLRTACAQNKAWQEAGYTPLCLTVNVSSRQFQNPSLVDLVEQVLEETGLDPKWLELEVTEGTAMQNIDVTISNMSRLKERGVRFSIDDFGTGYSSLNYLKRLPIQKVKIDKSFIHGLMTDSNDETIVEAVIAMAHKMRFQVVAEGVETEEQWELLRSCGCDAVQGYCASEPLPAPEFEKSLALPEKQTRRKK